MWKSVMKISPGWLVANEGSVTVALDVMLTDALKREELHVIL